MRSWRIAIEEAALDRSCEGAKKSGGHWHRPGLAALYTATTAELAVLEKFVHAEQDNSPLVLLAIDLPDDPNFGLDIPLVRLPSGWDEMPTSTAAAEFGSAFLKQCTHLYMRVPSTIVREATNLVINPLHRDYDKVRLQVVRPFSFDLRLFKQ